MKKHIQTLGWIFSLLILLVGNTSCNQFEFDEDDLTFPTPGYVGQLTNFYVGERISGQFEWNSSSDTLCVNVPEAGDYLLTYVIKMTNNDFLITVTEPEMTSNSFTIAFRANAPARLYVGLRPSETLVHFTLQSGTVKDDAIGLYDDGPIIRYATPSIPTIFWNDVFILPPNAPFINFVKGNFVCPSPFLFAP